MACVAAGIGFGRFCDRLFRGEVFSLDVVVGDGVDLRDRDLQFSDFDYAHLCSEHFIIGIDVAFVGGDGGVVFVEAEVADGDLGSDWRLLFGASDFC